MKKELPHHRKDRLQAILDKIPHHQKRVLVKRWQQVLGELRSMSVAIHSSMGLFSLMQEALQHQSKNGI
jgi:hypothetical protein